MAYRVFIDGEAGTTGLQIRERLQGRSDIEMLSLPDSVRKDRAARTEALNAADIVLLCLPDDAAREAVSLISNPEVRVIDASTAHRVADGWEYGFPELAPTQRGAIAGAKRVANPGCYSTGAIALLRPLTDAGVLPADFPLTINAISGYSGGGKKLIEEFETGAAPDTFRPYGLSLEHKHLPEIVAYGGLKHPPVFAPSVGAFAQGMLVELPLPLWALPQAPSIEQLREIYAQRYEGEAFIDVAGEEELAQIREQRVGAGGYVAPIDPEALNNTNRLRIFVFGNDRSQQARILAQLDNLGKGASGAAVQNLNLMLGLTEETGL